MQYSKLGSLRHQNRQQTEYSQTTHKPTWLLRINRILNSTARPGCECASSLFDYIADWLSLLTLAIYIFVVINFVALVEASDFRIERRQVAFLCWMQDWTLVILRHQIAYRLNAQLQIDWAKRIKQNLTSTARPYDGWAFSLRYFTTDYKMAKNDLSRSCSASAQQGTVFNLNTITWINYHFFG